jgi:hypothetical protein
MLTAAVLIVSMFSLNSTQPDSHDRSKPATIDRVVPSKQDRNQAPHATPATGPVSTEKTTAYFADPTTKPRGSDLALATTNLIESMRAKPHFGEWSMRYLVITDALRADLNGDGNITVEDSAIFVDWLDWGDPQADFSGDGTLTMDVVAAFAISAESLELIEVRRVH